VEQFANNALTTLNGSITSGATSLVVTSAANFPSSGNFRIAVDSGVNLEYMLVTGVSGTTFTVTRGIESTTRVAHLSGVVVTQIITAGAISQVKTDTIAGSVLVGLSSALPAATGSGIIYFATDIYELYVDNPGTSTWLNVPAGTAPNAVIALYSGVSTSSLSSYLRVGGISVDMSIYPTTYGTLNRTVKFQCDFSVSNGSDVGAIQLWDATHGVQVSGTATTTSNTTTTRYLSSALTVGSSSGNIRNDVVTEYEVQIALQTGSSPDVVVILGSNLQITYA